MYTRALASLAALVLASCGDGAESGPAAAAAEDGSRSRIEHAVVTGADGYTYFYESSHIDEVLAGDPFGTTPPPVYFSGIRVPTCVVDDLRERLADGSDDRITSLSFCNTDNDIWVRLNHWLGDARSWDFRPGDVELYGGIKVYAALTDVDGTAYGTPVPEGVWSSFGFVKINRTADGTSYFDINGVSFAGDEDLEDPEALNCLPPDDFSAPAP